MKTSMGSVQSGLSLRANFSWTFAGNIVYSACQWGSLAILARLGSPEMVGQFGLGLAVATPIMVALSLGVEAIQGTDAKHEYEFGEYLALRLITTLLALLIIAVAAFSLGYRFEVAIIIIVLGLARSFESISQIFYGFFQIHERMDYSSHSLMLKGFLSLLGMTIGIYLTRDVFWGVTGMMLAWAGLLFTYDLAAGLRLQREILSRDARVMSNWAVLATLRPRLEWVKLRNLVRLSLPLGLTALLFTLSSNITRYFVDYNLGEHALGIYVALAYLPVVAHTVASALARTAQPRLAKQYAAGDRNAYQSLVMKLIGIGAALGLVGTLASQFIGREVINILYGPEYAYHANILVLIMVSIGFNFAGWFLGSAMLAARYIQVQVYLLLASNAVQVLGCFWLIPLMGLQGAAIVQILVAVVSLILSFIVMSYILRRFPEPVSTAHIVVVEG